MRLSLTYVISPPVEGKPYSSNNRIKSPNCPCKSPNTFIGAFNWHINRHHKIHKALKLHTFIIISFFTMPTTKPPKMVFTFCIKIWHFAVWKTKKKVNNKSQTLGKSRFLLLYYLPTQKSTVKLLVTINKSFYILFNKINMKATCCIIIEKE